MRLRSFSWLKVDERLLKIDHKLWYISVNIDIKYIYRKL